MDRISNTGSYPKSIPAKLGWNEMFWSKELSWTRKYKNNTLEPKFFGSTTFLVWITDGWHLLSFIYNRLIQFCIALSYTNSFNWELILIFVGLGIIHGLFFSLFYK